MSALNGSKIALAPLRLDDHELLFRWINDRAEVMTGAGYRPVHESSHRAWAQSIAERDDAVIFGMRTVDDDRLIGYVQLVEIDWRTRSAELRIRIGQPDARGQTLGTEAGALILRHAFDDLNLRRIWAHVFAANVPTLQGAKTLGFQQEGVLREAAFVDGEYVDVIVIGMLRDDFRPPESISERG